jgi:K(+)-stimulated pyrophosphate-energized sodium pump
MTNTKSRPWLLALAAAVTTLVLGVGNAAASEASLKLPDLSGVKFLGGINGHALLMVGLLICVLGLVFGMVIYGQLKRLPVHKSMLEVSELIYATCKTYLLTQIKFILILELFIGGVIFIYFKFLAEHPDSTPAHPMHGWELWRVLVVLVFSLIGIAGSASVAAFGIRINTFANSRTAFASLRGKPFPVMSIPLRAGMSIGMVLISIELLLMLLILLFIPRDMAGACFIGFAIGESLGAAALRVAGGIFTKIADIGADLMKIVFNVKEDDARNPGVIADCVGDNAGDSVGPTADGFETYGVTGVALISFILLAITPAHFLPAHVLPPTEVVTNATQMVATPDQWATAVSTAGTIQTQLLVWIFAMRIVMVLVSGAAYLINESFVKAKYGNADSFHFERPLEQLVWLTSIVSVICTFIASYLLIPELHGDGTMWWKLGSIISCGTLAGAIIPEMTTVFTSTRSRHVKEVVTASREGGASLNVLSGLTAGNFSAFWIGGVTISGLMAIAYLFASHGQVQHVGLSALMAAPAVFAFGLVAFGFLGMGPVTIAVDSYGPVTDNAQSVYELSLIEQIPGIKNELKSEFGFDADFERSKLMLEENDGAGNTFKATAKPVLIGTAVVGATTMIFSIIVLLTNGLTTDLEKLSILHAPFLLGLLMGGAVIYWFSGASCQAVITGAYRAVAFIKRHMKLEGATKASKEDSQRVVAICTKYAQAGMFNIFLAIFFLTLAFSFVESFFFIGFLIALAFFGLFQAIFMANAGGAWDNAKKIVETELREKGTELHAATVVGDTVGDPFKDTSSVAMNPIIKFSTLFGLLAVELAIQMRDNPVLKYTLAGGFFLVGLVFVYRSFYAMRIEGEATEPTSAHVEAGQHREREVATSGAR